jgi:L-ascorbate metabolism protein UlaG (beta-lactamase superfamily)
MQHPFLRNDALLADIAGAPTDTVAIWWLGQSTFLVKSAVGSLLFDPYLSESLSKKYATSDKPHVRMTELVIDPARLDFIDVATSTHNHTDHLDGETLIPLMNANPDLQLVIPEANRAFVADRLQCASDWPVGMSDGDTRKVGPYTFTAVPAAHETIDRDDEGRCHYLGYVVDVGGVVVYHSGDTLLYASMADTLRPFNIDVAILPINGRDPARRVAGNLNGEQAATLANDIGAGIVIPCHYDMFEFNTASPKRFVQTCKSLGQPCCVLQNGERWDGQTNQGQTNQEDGGRRCR